MVRHKALSTSQQAELLDILHTRFEKNMHRHPGLEWQPIKEKLNAQSDKLWSLHEMERTRGEPDVVRYDSEKNEFVFYDFSLETPQGRRNLCYDRAALNARKQYKPLNSAVDIASEMGIEILDEMQYFELQQIELVDRKTSSWLLTPEPIRALGGAIFGDWRFGRVFIYHNNAEAYYSSRGFRGSLHV